MSTTEQNKTAVRRLYEEVVSADNLESLQTLFDKDYVGAGIGKGPEAFALAIKELQGAFPDLGWTVHDLFGEGDKVAVRWSWTGTHVGAFKGFAATGKVVTNEANVIYEFRDGKIVASWLQSDRLSVLQQIGAIQGKAPAANKA